MKTRIRKLAIALGAATALGLCTFVASAHPAGDGPGCSQEGPGMGAGFGPGMGPGMGRGYGHPMAHGFGPGAGRGPGLGNPLALAEGHLAWLKAELAIAPAQESAWVAFAEQGRQQAKAMQAWRAEMQKKATAATNAVERMELRNQMLKQRQEQAEKMTTAFKGLYSAATAEQKAKLDQGLGGPGFGHGFRGR